MNVLEKDLEELIYDCLKSNKMDLLVKRGLRPINRYKIYNRQLDLGVYGRLDLVGFQYHAYTDPSEYKKLRVGVFEFKKDQVNINTYLQAIRYCKGIEHYVSEYYDYIKCDFEIYLIGTSFCKSDFCYLPDFVDNLHIYTATIDLEEGVIFKEQRGYISIGGCPSRNSKLEGTLKNHIIEEIKEKITVELPF